MLELVVTACFLAGNPKPAIHQPSAVLPQTTCSEHVIGEAPLGMGKRACVAQALPALASWAGEHPGWVIKKWRCRVKDAVETDA